MAAKKSSPLVPYKVHASIVVGDASMGEVSQGVTLNPGTTVSLNPDHPIVASLVAKRKLTEAKVSSGDKPSPSATPEAS